MRLLTLDTILSCIFKRFPGLLGHKHTMCNIYNTYLQTHVHICEHISLDLIPWLQFIHFEFPEFLNKHTILTCSPNTIKISASLKLISLPKICLINKNSSTVQTLINAFAWPLLKHLRNQKGLKVPRYKPLFLKFQQTIFFLMKEELKTYLKW